MANWQDTFRGYATETAFSVAVSKAQVSLMAAIEADEWLGWTNAGGSGNLYTTYKALERRGLAEYNDEARGDPNWTGWRYRLTPAGAAVLELAKLAGVQAAFSYSEPLAA